MCRCVSMGRSPNEWQDSVRERRVLKGEGNAMERGAQRREGGERKEEREGSAKKRGRGCACSVRNEMT